MTTRSLEFLDRSGADYDYIDVEDDPAASEWVKQQNGGKEKKPTIDVDGQVLLTPSNAELQKALEEKHLIGVS